MPPALLYPTSNRWRSDSFLAAIILVRRAVAPAARTLNDKDVSRGHLGLVERPQLFATSVRTLHVIFSRLAGFGAPPRLRPPPCHAAARGGGRRGWPRSSARESASAARHRCRRATARGRPSPRAPRSPRGAPGSATRALRDRSGGNLSYASARRPRHRSPVPPPSRHRPFRSTGSACCRT